MKKKKIPRDKGFDHTLDLIREGYLFIGHRAYHYQSDLFETRLLGKKVVCMTGATAAKLFYDPSLFERKKVMPRRVKETLTGKGGVQGLDGEAHQERKAFLMSLDTPKREKELASLATKAWEDTIKKWPGQKKVVLFKEAKRVLCQAACQWVGIQQPLPEKQAQQAADALGEMIFGFGKLGIDHWKGRFCRNKMERSFKEMIDGIRNNRITVDEDTILYDISYYRDKEGKLMDAQIAAVELLNLIRPIVAIAVYITFAAVALYENPAYKVRLKLDDEGDKERFNEEVRRYYPFAPFIGAKVKRNFIWKHYTFKKGRLVLLDLYGTNHDERLWKEPYTFDPDRYQKENKDPYHFMPQGGGSLKGHRCMGENITMVMMNIGLDTLVNKISYELPPQDLSYGLSSIPTLPSSGVILSRVKLIKDYK